MADEPAGRTSLGVLREILNNLGDSNQYHYVVEALEALKNLLGEGGIGEAVSDWLAAHPEATTTVQNGSITLLKLANDVKSAIDGKAESSDLQTLADNLEALAQTVAEKADASDLDDKADIDGYYSQLTAGLAENLIGRGDAVPAEYLYRTAGGTADIEDGIATIDCIKGNTLVWNQLNANPNSTSTASDVRFANNGDGSWTFNGTASGRNSKSFHSNMSLAIGHKYLIKGCPSGGSTSTYYMGISGEKTDTGEGGIYNNSSLASGSLRFDFYEGASFDNVVIWPQIFDLTQMFGAGNEPATVAEFEAMFPLPYYPYSAPKLLPVDMRGIETVGFNAYNPSTGEAELLGGHQYQISGTYTSLSYSTGESIALDSDGIFTPSENGTLTVTGGNATDICVHLVWSGYRNGEYEEHWSAERPIDTSRFFPTGMKKAGDKADALYADHYDTVIGAVDLGTLTWAKNTSPAFFSAVIPTKANPVTSMPNGVCAALQPVMFNDMYNSFATIADDSFAISNGSNSRVYVKKTSCADAAALAAALNGVILYYELATPTTTPIDPPLNLSYKVSDFGTERIMVDETADAPQTAPVPMEVEYGINAIDTIRRLPKEYQSHKSMGQLTAALESSLGVDITETWDETEQRYEYEVSDFELADNSIPDSKLVQTGGVLERVNSFTTTQAVNLFNVNDPDVVTGSLIDGYGAISTANYMNVSGYIPIKPNVAYEVPIYVGKIGVSAKAIPIYDASKNHIQHLVGEYDETTKRLTFTTTNSSAAYVRVNFPARGQRALYYTPWHYYGIFMLTEAPFPDRYYTYGAKKIITDTAYLPESRENDYSPLIAKKALFYGDSICYGDDYDGWAGRVGRENRMTWENMGISGATFHKNSVAGCIVEQPVPFDQPDYIILEGGTNDADRIGNATGETKPAAFGTWSYTEWGTDDASTSYGFDITTFCGAFEYMLKRITTLYPGVKLGYIAAQKMGRTTDYRSAANNRRYYFQTAMEICEKWGVPYLNLWDGCYLNPSNPSMYNSDAQGDPAYCYIDGQHLTAKGYDYITPIIEAWMKTL